jgi:adenylylsulfate kinase
MSKGVNVIWQAGGLTREDRERQNGQIACVVWFTGLPCSGKSTIAHAVERTLHAEGRRVYVLDGDNVRHGLCGDLGFSIEDRDENVRRVAEVSALLCDGGLIVLTAFISPLRDERLLARSKLPHGRFFEVFCDADLSVCEERDVKGLYERARRGEIDHYTGISSPYQAPENPELRLDTAALDVESSARVVIELLGDRGIIPREDPHP